MRPTTSMHHSNESLKTAQTKLRFSNSQKPIELSSRRNSYGKICADHGEYEFVSQVFWLKAYFLLVTLNISSEKKVLCSTSLMHSNCDSVYGSLNDILKSLALKFRKIEALKRASTRMIPELRQISYGVRCSTQFMVKHWHY